MMRSLKYGPQTPGCGKSLIVYGIPGEGRVGGAGVGCGLFLGQQTWEFDFYVNQESIIFETKKISFIKKLRCIASTIEISLPKDNYSKRIGFVADNFDR